MRNVLTFKLFLCSRQMVYGGAGCMLLVLTQSGLTNGQSDRMLLQATWIRFVACLEVHGHVPPSSEHNASHHPESQHKTPESVHPGPTIAL